MTLSPATVEALRISDVAYLAPGFRTKLLALVAAMAKRGQPARVVETLRLPRLHQHYVEQGTTQAPTVFHSWHGYGLAADVVHATQLWDAPAAFWDALGAEAERLGLRWGGRWKFVDKPHVQLGDPMRVSPSAKARALLKSGGLYAVWKEIGAV